MHDVSHPPSLPAERTGTCWTLAVHMLKRIVGSGLWQAPSWSVAAVDSDRVAPEADRCVQLEATDDGSEHLCWHGIELELHRDERAAYRFNLSAARPRLFVHCAEQPDGRMRPMLVTASQDVAASYMDGGDEDVFSVDMPEAIQCWIEAFIARHGEPELTLGKGHRRQRGKSQEAGGDA